uniref:Ensconsin n=1 Tax=Mesocestoides corti TaxID=53468 RepID=A0A5K3FE88_MESCO
MAEVEDLPVVSSTSESKENDVVSTSEPLPQSDHLSISPAHLSREYSQQPSTTNSSVSGGNNGLTSERRRKLLAEAEYQKTEQRRLQILESQKRAEAQREKQKEERKRRIEETRQREEARQRKAQETKKEIERQYRDHMQTLLQRNRERTVANSDQHRQPPTIMRASHMHSGPSKPATVSSASSDRMATSFTVAFGSSTPRSICTKANEAALRSQAAFEARLASYLNGRHSGCFLTQSSAYTTYALYVKPDLLPEDHPIRKHHQQQERHSYTAVSPAPRRAASANPGLQRHNMATPTLGKGSPITRAGRVGTGTTRAPRAASASRQPQPQSRPPERAATGLPPLRKAASIQHFAVPTIAYASKVKGAPPPEIPTARTVKPNSATEGVGTLPQRRTVPGRSGVSRDRCNSYAAPTTASANRQRAISHDQKQAHDNFSSASSTSTTLSHRKPSVPNALEGRGRSQKRAVPTTTAKPPEPIKTASKPVPNKQSKPVPIKKPATVTPAETGMAAEQSSESKPVTPTPDSPPAAMPSVSPVASTLAQVRPSPAPPTSLAEELESTQAELPAEPQQGPHSPPAMSLAAELDSAVSPPLEGTSVPEETLEVEAPAHSTSEEKEPVPAEDGPEAVPEVTSTVVDDDDANKADRKPSEEEPSPANVVVAAATEEKEAVQAPRKPTPPPGPLPSGPIKASTTGSGEGGCLPEEEAAIYRAKMAEQRRLAKERLAEQERREAEEERERNERREAERQAAIQAARERAIEEARLAAESRQAREAAEQEARLQAEREAQERAARERQRLEAIERERLENFRRAEEERAMRKKRLDSIMSRVNRSDRSLSRGVANSESSNSLPGMMTTSATNAGGDQPATEGGPKQPPVHFSLGHGREPADSSTTVPNQNGISNGYPKFTSPLLQSLLSGSNRFAGDSAASAATTGGVSTDTRLPDDSQESSQRPSPAPTNFPMGTVGNGSNS